MSVVKISQRGQGFHNVSNWANRTQNRRFARIPLLTDAEIFHRKMKAPRIFQELCEKCAHDCKVVWGRNSQFQCFDFKEKDHV